MKHRGDVLERLALEQAGEQQITLFPERELLVEVDVVATRKQAACLQLDERRGDEEELGRDVEVEPLGVGGDAIELGQVRVDDRAQRHLIEVDLLAHDQVEQEIEGPLEHRGLHLVGHAGRLAAGVTPA